jgi:hypothetical protein
MGTTVYQGDNRYSLNDIQFFQNRLEFKHNKGFIRIYNTYEDAGNTYDAVFTALLMQEATKKDYEASLSLVEGSVKTKSMFKLIRSK